MFLTRLSLSNPSAVVAGFLLLLIFGVLCLLRMPVQLTPEIVEPEISITTVWRGAAPNEIESDIIEPQEDALRGVPGMTELLSVAQQGRAELNLRFTVDMDMRRALIEVINRMNQISDYPSDVDEPIISSVGADVRAIAWFIVKTVPGNDRPISSYQDFLEEVVQSRFEQVRGVARSNVYGGNKNELRITFDPYKVADLGLDIGVVNRLAGSSRDTSAGFQDIGKREYNLRYIGEYDAAQLGEMILQWRDSRPVYLRDVASIAVQMRDRDGFVITKGTPAIAINAQRESGINVLQVMDRLRQAAKELSEGPLKRAGLTIEQVYDETEYIDRSITMLGGNIAVGIFLSTVVLFVFFLSLHTTLLVTVAIPCCLLGSFCCMYLFDRTLNVISLAGLALSVGMVLDASLIVLENIVRLRGQGMDLKQAAKTGTDQVWGALLASTATTVALFLPVLFLREEVGQLFADLALAIVVAISLSLLVAVTIIPSLSSVLLGKSRSRDHLSRFWEAGTRVVMYLTDSRSRRGIWIALLTAAPLFLVWHYRPEADYLPSGNRNLVFAYILPPPGVNVDELERAMGGVIQRHLQPYLEGGGMEPEIKHYFFVTFPRGVFLGARARDETRVRELVGVINEAVRGIPDTLAFARQTSLFQGARAGRTINVNIQSQDMNSLLDSAREGFLAISQRFEGMNVRPRPGLELAQPELRIIPDERRIAEAGWDRAVLAQILRTLGDGLYVGDYFDGEKSIDIVVRSEPWETVGELAAIPVVTPDSGILPLSELATIEHTVGPEEIRRIDRRRTVTLEVTPSDDMSLEQALSELEDTIEPIILTRLPEDGDVRYAGVADKLESALKSMSGTFVLALIILYLLLSALFQSFSRSLLVMWSLPLATVGGIMGLHFLNYAVPQNMDLLTMIGFVILLGVVVNNAILLVYYAEQEQGMGVERRQAVRNAIRNRFRPIVMSTMTSVCGMLPLLLIPGTGTELYRGLAAVMVGGMSVSTLFTLILLPSMLRMGEQARPVGEVGT